MVLAWRRSWTLSLLLIICLIYTLGLFQDEQFIQAYTSWLPQKLSGEYEDPILKVLNSTDTPFNISLEANGLFYLSSFL
jgi:hypothetical protein